MTPSPYLEPVSALLTYGDCTKLDKKIEDPKRDRIVKELLARGPGSAISRDLLAQLKTIPKTQRWPNYVETFGLGQAHVPELIRMAIDEGLNWAGGESREVWAPVHAWRSLGQLGAEAAIEPLMTFFKHQDEDWALEEIPWVLGMIGQSAIEPLAQYLANRRYKDRSRTSALESLERIGTQHSELRDRCIEKLVHQLKDYKRNPKTLNGFLVSSLIELEAAAEVTMMDAAYQAKRVDETICGTWANVQIDLGLASEADFTPEELKLPEPEWAKSLGAEPDKPSAIDLGLPTKPRDGELSMVLGEGKLPFAKHKATKGSKGFGGGKSKQPKPKKR